MTLIQMQGSQDRVAECTTSNFDGMISMLRPEESWVAKWQRIGKSRTRIRMVDRPSHVLVLTRYLLLHHISFGRPDRRKSAFQGYTQSRWSAGYPKAPKPDSASARLSLLKTPLVPSSTPMY